MEFSTEYISAVKDVLVNSDLVNFNSDLYEILWKLNDYPSRVEGLKVELAGIDPKLEELEKKYKPLKEAVDRADEALNSYWGNDPKERDRLLNEYIYANSNAYGYFEAINYLKGSKKSINLMLEFLENVVKESITKLNEQLSLNGDALVKAYPHLAQSIAILKQFQFETENPEA